MNIFLRQRWNDPRLRLPTDFKSEALTVDPNMFQCLWKPDLFFANEKNANFHDVTQDNILLFIFRNGDVLISMRYAHPFPIFVILSPGPMKCSQPSVLSELLPHAHSLVGIRIINVGIFKRCHGELVSIKLMLGFSSTLSKYSVTKPQRCNTVCLVPIQT